MKLAAARERAWDLIKIAKAHGVNPKDIEERIEAAELTLGQVFAQYVKHLKGRAEPAKPNSILSVEKASDKLKDWNGRKVRMITPSEVIERFDLHAVDKGPYKHGPGVREIWNAYAHQEVVQGWL